MAEDFSKALISAYNEIDMTLQFSDVLLLLQGKDVNFEIIKSQTARPLKLAYTYNKAHVLRAYIFAQTELKGFEKYTFEKGQQTVTERIEMIKQQLQDKEALGIDAVEVFVDLSKAETT